MTAIVEELRRGRNLPEAALKELIECADYDEELFRRADEVRRQYYGTDVYIRGLIELTNYCKNDCFYCGIRRSNTQAVRYRLSRQDILECCREGYALGFRTFVLQGGEDGYYTDDRVCEIVSDIRAQYPDCAITLSLGEKPYESYLAFFKAGADRYLLRHETADETHYRKLHPPEQKLSVRKQCLWNLKKIGYPGRLWVYGWLAVSDNGKSDFRPALPAGAGARDDRHWTFYSASSDAVWGICRWNTDAQSSDGGDSAADVSLCTDSRHDSAWHDSPAGAGAGAEGGGKRGDAQPVTGEGAQAL